MAKVNVGHGGTGAAIPAHASPPSLSRMQRETRGHSIERGADATPLISRVTLRPHGRGGGPERRQCRAGYISAAEYPLVGQNPPNTPPVATHPTNQSSQWPAPALSLARTCTCACRRLVPADAVHPPGRAATPATRVRAPRARATAPVARTSKLVRLFSSPVVRPVAKSIFPELKRYYLLT
jgi:hypothetical protein